MSTSPYNNALQKSIQYSNSMQLPASPEPLDFGFNSDDLIPTSALDIPDDEKHASTELLVVGNRQQRITLGRGGSCTVKIGRRNRQISRTHVAIEYVNGEFELVVLGLNGATVDRILYRQHERAPLYDHSIVDVLGDVVYFRLPPPFPIKHSQQLQKIDHSYDSCPAVDQSPVVIDMENNHIDDKENSHSDDKENNYSDDRENVSIDDKESNRIDDKESNHNDDKENNHIDDKENSHIDDKENSHIDDKENSHIDDKENVYIDDKENSHIDDKESNHNDDKENAYTNNKESKHSDDKENAYTNDKKNTFNNDEEMTCNEEKENKHSQEDTTDYAENIIDILVFSRKSSMPISDICSRIIKTNPNYKKQDRGMWTDRIQRVLKEKPFFGEIVRKGKTADGSPKENLYYYNSDMDPVEWRRATYTQVGRSARKCTLQDKQYFWRIPPKLGKNRHAYIPPPAAPLQEKRKLNQVDDDVVKKQKI